MQKDELAVIIAEAPGARWDDFSDEAKVMFHQAAAAVRAYSNREDVVERAACIIGIHLDGYENSPLLLARAAINAMLGGKDG